MTPEGLIKKSIMDWLRAQPGAFGWLIQVGKIPGRTNHSKGIADIIGCWHGRGLAIEVKTAKGKLSDEQEAFLYSWRHRCGGIAIVARSLQDVIDVLKREGAVLTELARYRDEVVRLRQMLGNEIEREREK